MNTTGLNWRASEEVKEYFRRGWGRKYVEEVESRGTGINYNKAWVNMEPYLNVRGISGHFQRNLIVDTFCKYGFLVPDTMMPEGKRIIDFFHPFEESNISKLRKCATDEVTTMSILMSWFEFDVLNGILYNLERNGIDSVHTALITVKDKIDLMKILNTQIKLIHKKSDMYANLDIKKYFGNINLSAMDVFTNVLADKINAAEKLCNNGLDKNSDFRYSLILVGNHDVSLYLHRLKEGNRVDDLKEINNLVKGFQSLIKK